MGTKAKVHGVFEGLELTELCSVNCSLHTASSFVSLYEWAQFLQHSFLVAITQISQPFLLGVDNQSSEIMFFSGAIFARGFTSGEGWGGESGGERQGNAPVTVHQKWQNHWLEKPCPEPCIETQENNWKWSGLSSPRWGVRTGVMEILPYFCLWVAHSIKAALEKKHLINILPSLHWKNQKSWGSSCHC